MMGRFVVGQFELNKKKWERERKGPHWVHFEGLGSIL